MFKIVGDSLVLLTSPDFETKSSFDIRVRATDQSGASSDTHITGTFVDVNEAPTISEVPDQEMQEDTPTTGIPVTIADSEKPVGDLIITIRSSNTALIPDANLVLEGSGTERNLILTPAANESGTTIIQLTVSDGELVTTREISVVVAAVDDPPVITLAAQPLVLTSGKPTAIDRTATITDVDTLVLDFDGSVLHVTGQVGKDQLRILKLDGIRRKGKTVTSSGIVIGTMTGGKKGVPLQIQFNHDAHRENVQSLLRAIAVKLVGATTPRIMNLQITNIQGLDTNQATRQIEKAL
jgi:hypothetical protein